MHDDILFRHLGGQSLLIQNQWLVATLKIKIRKMNSHTPPTVDTQSHTNHVTKYPTCNNQGRIGRPQIVTSICVKNMTTTLHYFKRLAL